VYTPITIEDFKTFFTRDFPYGTTPEVVMDVDITKALATAGINFNEGLWSSQESFNQAYLYLAAHFLVESIRMSSSGLNSQYAGNVSYKAVGAVTETYVMPIRIQRNPFLAGLFTTRYGALYVGLLAPRLVGHVMTVRGDTTP